MKTYDADERMTMYFVVRKSKREGIEPSIQAWSDDEYLVKAYMDFHKCKNFKIRTMTNRFDNITKILEENHFDEIILIPLTIRDPDNHNKSTTIVVPMTQNEHSLVTSEAHQLLGSRIKYQALSASIEFLKEKYQRAFAVLHLQDAIKQSLYEQTSPWLLDIDIDELVVFARLRPEDF